MSFSIADLIEVYGRTGSGIAKSQPCKKRVTPTTAAKTSQKM